MSVVEVKEMPAIHGIGIRRTCKHTELGTVMAEIFPQLYEWAPSRGGIPAGPPYSLYFDWRKTDADLAGFIPLAQPIEGAGEFEAMTISGGPTAVYEHIGPYDQLETAHGAVMQYLETHDLKTCGPVWEQYLSDPGETPVEQTRTLIGWPIEK